MPRNMKHLVLAIAAVAACHAQAAPTLARPARGVVDLTAIQFRTDDGRVVPAELGRFHVPERRRAGATRMIELAFVRFGAEHPPGGPPIVYLAGGPGAGGTEHARGPRFALLMALRQAADVIVLDQRGTGLSQRLPPCPLRWSLPLELPASRGELEAEIRRHAQACGARWRADGVDLDAYNTEESADDVDELRRAIGAERIALVGASYGTHLALAVIRRHGRSVDRAILAGVEGPDATLKLPSDQEALLRRIAELVASDPDAARAYPDFWAALGDLLRALDRTPAVVTLAGDRRAAITRFDVENLVAGALRGPDTIRTLPRVVDEMRHGDFSSLRPYVAALRSGTLEAMPAAMDLASGASPARRARIAAERTATLIEDAINFPHDAIRAGLGVAELDAAFRTPLASDVPVLLISGTLDGRTPPHNAEELRAGLARSTHVILDGVGHGDGLFLASPEILRLGLAFLRGASIADHTIPAPPLRFELPHARGDR